MSDPLTKHFAMQATATVTLLGVVAYLVHELAKNGMLNRGDFEKHLEDLGAPDSESESPEEMRMRASILKMIRKAAAAEVDDGKRF